MKSKYISLFLIIIQNSILQKKVMAHGQNLCLIKNKVYNDESNMLYKLGLKPNNLETSNQ